jgi:hypothetical protein
VKRKDYSPFARKNFNLSDPSVIRTAHYFTAFVVQFWFVHGVTIVNSRDSVRDLGNNGTPRVASAVADNEVRHVHKIKTELYDGV